MSSLNKKKRKDYPQNIDTEDHPHNTIVVNGIFLVLVSIATTFVLYSFSEEKRNYIFNSVLIKHLAIIFFLYFSIANIVNEKEHPAYMLGDAIVIWIIFLIFIKLEGTYMLVAVVFIVLYYAVNEYIEYHKEMYKKTWIDAGRDKTIDEIIDEIIQTKHKQNTMSVAEMEEEDQEDVELLNYYIEWNKRLVDVQTTIAIIIGVIFGFGYLHYLLDTYSKKHYITWSDIF